MSEKKMVRRSVAIGVGIVSIILVAGLVGVLAYYMPIVNDKDNIIASRDSQIASLNSNVTSLQNQVNNLNSSVKSLRDQMNNLTDILNLQKSSIWFTSGTVNIMGSAPTCEENAAFAGYVSVEVSSQYNVTVEVRYFSHGANYDNSIILGNSGTAVFPVLPANISIYSFQTWSEQFVLSGPLYASVTITYYY
jgi:outer membrane murein-binding lipoprotein Lpp